MLGQVDYQVIIVGGGIGGLTVAALCRRLQISCKVLERAGTLRPAGAAISLAPNALRVLDQIGIYGEIQKLGQKMTKILISRNDVLWNTLDWTLCEEMYGYPVYSIERLHLIRLLQEATDPDAVELNAVVQDIIDDAEEPTVTVKLADGRELRSSIVIGADGIRSLTRRILARNAGLKEANTLRFTGRVNMSGITKPMKNLGPQDLGVANWLFYDNTALMTFGCQNNKQWFAGVKVRKPLIWAHSTPMLASWLTPW
jgi:salicylate hydroxylase